MRPRSGFLRGRVPAASDTVALCRATPTTQPPAHFDLPELREFGPSPARSYPPPQSPVPPLAVCHLSSPLSSISIHLHLGHHASGVFSYKSQLIVVASQYSNISASGNLQPRVGLSPPRQTFAGHHHHRCVRRTARSFSSALAPPPDGARALARYRSFATGHSFIFSSTVRVAVAAPGVRARVFSVFRLPYISSLHHSAVDINHPRLK